MVLDGVLSEAVGACDDKAVGKNIVRGMVLAVAYTVPLGAKTPERAAASGRDRSRSKSLPG